MDRSIDATERELARLCSELGHNERAQCYKRQLADRAEHAARRKAASGREPDLRHLVDISVLQERQGITAWAAARQIADEIGGDARLRHANKKRLYAKFQKAPALYQRLSLAGGDPGFAAEREICESLARFQQQNFDWQGSWQDLMVHHVARK